MEHYELQFSSNGTEIKIASHEKAWVEEKEKQYKTFINKILSIETRVDRLDEKSDSRLNAQKDEAARAVSINEFYRKFIHEKKIRTLTDIATYFMYFLTKVKNQDIITSNDVKNLFKEVRYPSWNKINISDVMMRARQKALLNSHDNNWSLTITGEDFVLNSMSESNAK